MRTLLLSSLVLSSVIPAPHVPVPPSIVTEGVPEIPTRIEERAHPYQHIRGASLLDWDPGSGGALIATRFAETSQLHHVLAPGAARTQLTFFAEPVSLGAFDPARAGKGFLFAMDAGGNELYQLYWYDASEGRPMLITDGKSRNEGLAVSNRGGVHAYSSTRRNGKDFDIWIQRGPDPARAKLAKEVEGKWSPTDWSADDRQILLHHYVSINESYLYVLDAETGALEAIHPDRPPRQIAHGSPVFGNKGRVVYYTSDDGSEFRRLYVHDLASGKREVLTPDLPWDVTEVDVSLDGRHLAYVANEGGRSALFLGRTERPKKAERIPLPAGQAQRAASGTRAEAHSRSGAEASWPGIVFGIAFDPEGRRLGFSLSSHDTASDVFSVDVGTKKLTRWTSSELGGLRADGLVAPELVEYTSFDGLEVSAWYYRPKAAPAKPLPVIVSIHGGPESQWMAWFNRDVQLYANELGAAVLLPNVRGSSGYGKSFVLLDNAEKREDSVKDIGALLDWIATRPELDRSRVAVLGGSYGGFMVLASMIRYAERLRCGVDIVGISNWVTFLENTESYRRDLRRVEYGDERDPKMRAFLESISPANRAAELKKPLLVAQGQNDPRVPASESEQMVRAVRKNSGTVWYVLAKDEGHGFQKKTNRDYLQNAIVLFFETFLLN